jgi:hypothetical protein
VLVMLLITAAVSPPRAVPTNSAFFRSSAMRFICCSARLLWIGTAPSAVNSVSGPH